MYRHVLCVYPYRVELSRSMRFPPLGLEMIAAALGPHAEAIDVVDLRLEEGRTVDFLRPDTDLVCFSVNWDKEPVFVREEIRSVPPGVLTMVGGRHASEDPERWLTDCPNVDILVRGDGEEMADEIARGRPLGEIAGVSFRVAAYSAEAAPAAKAGSGSAMAATRRGRVASGSAAAATRRGRRNGKVVHNPVRRCGSVRDDLWPDRSLRRYVYPAPSGSSIGIPPIDSVASSRGCPFNCKFCSFSRNPWGEKRAWSARSPESVVRELEQIDARYVVFVDDNFTHDMDRVGAICDLMVERGIRKRYAVNARVEIARRPDVLRKMERAGFVLLLLGIESAQDRTLRAMKKGFDTRQLREYFRVLRKSRMHLHGYFILGNIGETADEMLAIAPFARELGLDSMAVSLLRNNPYSGLEELVAAAPGYHINPAGDVYSDELPIARLRRIRREVCMDFFLRPAQILHLLKKSLRNRLLTPGVLARAPVFLVRKVLHWRAKNRAGS
ncbi:MAG: B12-binding domain-containing radical SAM protein [Planctomycetota bacterium]|jgi:radical SAM superfamily enzyme YgiQ (UPF0313 family)